MPSRTLWPAVVAAGAALLAACGSSSSSSTGGPASTSGAASTSTAVTYAMTISGSTMTPTDKLTATQGQTISLSFTTDKDEEIHLHGFDYKFECKKGVPQSKTFAADRTGAFEIEIEDSSTHLGELDINPS